LIMNPQELKSTLAEIEKSPSHPGYYFFGDDEYLKREFIGKVKSCIIEPSFSDFNFDEIWAGDIKDTRDFFDSLLALPVMLGGRLVVLREAERARAKFADALLKFDIPRGNFLIVESTPKRKTTSLHRGLAKKLLPYNCSVQNDREMLSWVGSLAEKYNLDLQQRTSKYLIERAGVNLDTLDAELSKLSLVCESGKPSTKDIDRLTAFSRSSSIFQFTDSFSSRDFGTALDISQRLFDFGESGTVMIALLKNELFSLLILKSSPDGSSKFRGPRWKLRLYSKWLRDWSKRQINNSIVTLAEADRAIKTSRLSEKQAIIEIIAYARLDN